MFAGQIIRPGQIELVDVPEPQLESDSEGEIIFQPQMTCLCGSDLPYFMGEDGHGPYPLEPGFSLHEMVGVVTESTSKKFQSGDKVLAVPLRQHGFFERYKVSDSRVITWDQRCSPEIAVLAQPLGTVIYSHKKLSGFLDKTVVVLGQGPIGQMHNRLVQSAGAHRVIGIDKLRSRLDRSPHFGVTETIDNSSEDPIQRVSELTDGKMADIVIECVGHQDQALNLCIDLCREEGKILYFGVPPKTIDSVRMLDLFMKNLSVHTSVDPDFNRDFPLAMKWLSEDRIDLSPLVTHRYPVEEIQKAYEVFRDREEGALKVLVEFPT